MNEFSNNFHWDRPFDNPGSEHSAQRQKGFDLSLYFESDGNGKLKCRFPGCLIKLSSSYSSNLFRHLKQRHPEVYPPTRGARLKRKRTEQELQSSNGSKHQQIHLRMTKDTIIRGCAELVTTNGMPFSLLQESGFRCILDPIVNAFTEAGISIDISEEGIRSYIEQQTQGGLGRGGGLLSGNRNVSEVLDLLDDSRSRDSENGFVGGSTGTDGKCGSSSIDFISFSICTN